jgi:membrane-associated phospholipid phosphatase
LTQTFVLILTQEYRHYRNAILFSLILAALVAIFLLFKGKEGSFLVINEHNSPAFDYVFEYWTYLGDGVIWVPLFLYVLLFKREFFIAVLASLIICTILTHFFKRIVFPGDMRPIILLGKEHIRTIQGLKINERNSFPSGHTSTAFTLALLMAYLVRGNFWVYFFPLVAFFVGYSRVYLAQHFVTDVLAGMCIGLISSYLSLLVYEQYRRKRKEKMEATIKETKKDLE